MGGKSTQPLGTNVKQASSGQNKAGYFPKGNVPPLGGRFWVLDPEIPMMLN